MRPEVVYQIPLSRSRETSCSYIDDSGAVIPHQRRTWVETMQWRKTTGVRRAMARKHTMRIAAFRSWNTGLCRFDRGSA